ncbi:50S ribosomal protein L25 [Chloroflexota bacterium]
MDQIELEVTNRETLGKKVRFLRRQGITPVHLFGHGIESVALQCDTAILRRVLAEAGLTGLISLKLDNEKRPRTVMVRGVQTEPLTGETLHVDFYQVKMAEQVRVEVPIVLVGEAPALKLKENMVMHELNTLTVECLPAKIPASVEVDLASLTESGQAVRVKDIGLDEGINVLNDPEMVVVRISTRHVEKVEEVVVEAEEEMAVAPEEESKEE